MFPPPSYLGRFTNNNSETSSEDLSCHLPEKRVVIGVAGEGLNSLVVKSHTTDPSSIRRPAPISCPVAAPRASPPPPGDDG